MVCGMGHQHRDIDVVGTPFDRIAPADFAPALERAMRQHRDELDRIQRQLKAEFDPCGIFNRGRLYGAW